ncbi:hypothetical protein F8S13_22450 [Chloroflexia bacterium SDU3-3]|nr:hypothetical protein F8S13_22450 [Chloroflexia bacterium SDU3-3]
MADLTEAGWLIRQTEPGQKLQLLATWGRGRNAQPRPLRFTRPDRGRPAQLRTIALPTDVFDHYLGRLTPNTEDAATVERYMDRPLLSFADIGALALARVTSIPPTPALAQLGLASAPGDDLPLLPLTDLLQQIDDGAHAPVQLTPSGAAHLRRLRGTGAFAAQGGPHGGPGGGPHGGPHADHAKTAAECAKTPRATPPFAAWDTWENKLIHDLPSEDFLGATAVFSDLHNEAPPEVHPHTPSPLTTAEPSQQPDHHAADCEENHSIALDPLLMGWHKALNPARTIRAAEWFALLDLQERYGADLLRSWMFRATNAGRTEVLPRYYAACAASEACAGLSSGKEIRPSATSRRPQAAPVAPAPTRAAAPPVAPLPVLDAARAQAVRALAEACGQPIRCPYKLAAAPLDLLARWQAIAAHPGLLATWQMGWVVAEVAKGSEPPPLSELNRWAEAKGLHWADPRMAPWAERDPWALLAAQESAPAGPENTSAAREPWRMDAPEEPPLAAQEPAGASGRLWGQAGIPPAEPTSPLPLSAVWAQVLDAMRPTTERAVFRAVLEQTSLVRLDGGMAVVAVPTAAVMQGLEARFTRPLREALQAHAGQGITALRVIIRR